MTTSDDEYGVPDDESPEWTDQDFVWSVSAADFGGDIFKVSEFLKTRESFLEVARKAGIPREAFLSLEPKKPGFLGRAAAALTVTLESTKHAAE